MAKKLVNFRLSEELIEKLKTVAERNNRSLNNFIETIANEYLSKNAPDLIISISTESNIDYQGIVAKWVELNNCGVTNGVVLLSKDNVWNIALSAGISESDLITKIASNTLVICYQRGFCLVCMED